MVFRGEARAPRRLHPLERALLIITALHLCFLPWALGGMHGWAQFVSLGLSAIAFSLSLINRQYTEDYAREGEFRLIMWPKLTRFPIFWLGLALLIYMAVQGFNPAWIYQTNGTSWWMVPVPHLSWLPTGMTAPYADMNAWRTIVIYGSPWLTACALWVGITRRVTLVALLGTLAINGGLLAAVGILMCVAGNGKILWFIQPSKGALFVSSFVYKNHAGDYFNLILTVCTGLMYWSFSRSERAANRANPAPIFGFAGVLLGMIVILSGSRAATILLLAFLAVSVLGLVLRLMLLGNEGRSPIALGLFAFILVLFVGGGLYALDQGRSIEGVERLTTQDFGSSVLLRRKAAEATWIMAKDNLVTGWGAGSYRHYFPMYQQHYPELLRRPDGRTYYWDYAHNDYLQILSELGLAGVALLIAGAAYWIFKLLRHQVFSRPHTAFMLMGLLMTMGHAWVDMPFYCPAILVTWCALWVLVVRWGEFEDNRVRD